MFEDSKVQHLPCFLCLNPLEFFDMEVRRNSRKISFEVANPSPDFNDHT